MRSGDSQGDSVHPVDVALATAVALMATLGTAEAAAPGSLDGVGYGLLAVGALPLVVHRRWPLGVFAVAVVTQIAYLLLGYPEGIDWLATAVALGSVTSAHGWRWAIPLVIICLGLSMSDVLDRGVAAFDLESAVLVVGSGCAVAVGEWVRTRRAYLLAVEEHAAMLERTKDREASRLVGEERLRIAREVHDVVAHAIASINVLAGAGEHVSARAPERAREALTAIRDASGEALEDLRSILGMLRDEDEAAADFRPGLADVDRLVTMAEEAGLETVLAVDGDRRPLPTPVDLAAYRIVQESVTNALKHAANARLEIALGYRPNALDLRVRDDGVGPGSGEITEGHGIRGMRERALMLGGRLEAGPCQGGGFEVSAHLPLPEGNR